MFAEALTDRESVTFTLITQQVELFSALHPGFQPPLMLIPRKKRQNTQTKKLHNTVKVVSF